MQTSIFVDQVYPHLPVTPKTLVNYRSAYSKNLHSKIGYKPIQEVTKRDLIDALAPLPPQTKYQTFIETSPLQGVPTPKVHVRPQEFLTWSELSAMDFGRHTAHIRFLALHGLRWGEAAALTEEDIYDGFVHITKSIHGATKTPSGVRKVPLISEFKEFPICQKYVAKALKPYGVTVHSLRKTYAYNLKEAGVHVTTAAKLMGHSNPMVTLKIYTLVRDSEILESGKLISNLIARKESEARRSEKLAI